MGLAKHKLEIVVFTIGNILIYGIAFLYFTVLYPMVFSSISIPSTLTTLLGLFILFNTLYSYYAVAFVSPGRPKDLYNSINEDYARTNGLYCSICEYWKPIRTHHCSTCNECVVNMDHHCIFVMNCIGEQNSRYFYVFILWAIAGCLFIGALSVPYIPDIILLRGGLVNMSPLYIQFAAMGLALCVAVVVGLCVLLGFQFHLIRNNMSTVEYLRGKSTLSSLMSSDAPKKTRKFRELLQWALPYIALERKESVHSV